MFQALDSYAQDVVEFARAHELWATPIAFMFAFGESLAFVSLFIPAWAALVGIGALIEAGELRFWPIWVGGASYREWFLLHLLASAVGTNAICQKAA